MAHPGYGADGLPKGSGKGGFEHKANEKQGGGFCGKRKEASSSYGHHEEGHMVHGNDGKGFGKGGAEDYGHSYNGKPHEDKAKEGGFCGKRKEVSSSHGHGAEASGKGFGKGGKGSYVHSANSKESLNSYGSFHDPTPIQNNAKGFRSGWMSGPAQAVSMQLGCGNWIIFALTCVFCGFFYHNHTTLIWSFAIACGLIALFTICGRYEQIMTYLSNPRNDGRLFWTLVPAWLLLSLLCGFGSGVFAHERFLRKFWLSQELIVRQNVLPSEPAAAYARAGEIGFAEEARIDLSKTIGYKDFDVYCVAPIAGDVPLEKVQFWAAGMNCCGARSGFVCDDAWDPKARAGIIIHDNEHSRLVKDMRPYYMKAVKMAEATYSIASVNEPVFVKWVADPDRVEWNFMIMGIAVIVCSILIAVILCICVAVGVGHTYPASTQETSLPVAQQYSSYAKHAGSEYEQQYEAMGGHSSFGEQKPYQQQYQSLGVQPSVGHGKQHQQQYPSFGGQHAAGHEQQQHGQHSAWHDTQQQSSYHDKHHH